MINIRLVVLVILSVQPGVRASEVSEALQLLQQQVLGIKQQMVIDWQHMQQQMATEKQQLQQETSADIKLLKQQLKEMQQHMVTERDEMQQDIASLEENCVSQRKDIASQKEEIVSQREDIASQKEEIQNLTYKLESENNSKQEKEGLNSYISFTAYATTSRDYNSGDHVMFDATVRNYGSAYLVNGSEFFCPVNGYYTISISLLADAGKVMYGMIMLEDEELVLACARDDATFGSARQTVVTYCAAGQKVWVKCFFNNSRMYAVYSIFSATRVM